MSFFLLGLMKYLYPICFSFWNLIWRFSFRWYPLEQIFNLLLITQDVKLGKGYRIVVVMKTVQINSTYLRSRNLSLLCFISSAAADWDFSPVLGSDWMQKWLFSRLFWLLSRQVHIFFANIVSGLMPSLKLILWQTKKVLNWWKNIFSRLHSSFWRFS